MLDCREASGGRLMSVWRRCLFRAAVSSFGCVRTANYRALRHSQRLPGDP